MKKKNMFQNFFVDVLIRLNVFYNCKKCENNFSSKNNFHKHFKICLCKLLSTKFSTTKSTIVFFDFSDFVISEFFNMNTNIKTWHFLTIKTSIDIETTFNNFCINTNCETFMTDRAYVTAMLSNYMNKVRIIASLKIKNINNVVIFSTKFIILNFSFSRTIDEKFAIAKISRKIRLMNNLSIKVFIKMNIIEFECMIINANILIINNCRNFKMNLSSISRNASMKRIIICLSAITVFSHTIMQIFIKLRKKKSLFNRDYMFHSKRIFHFDNESEIFSYIVNANFSETLITNNSNNSVIIFKRFRVNIIKEFDDENCYMMFFENAHSAVDNWNSFNLKVKATSTTA